MSTTRRALAIGLITAPLAGSALAQGGAADPLPSWREGGAKSAILDFLAAVTTEGGADFVPPARRIAVFDNDGTLWVEQPIYTQFAFALDRVRELAPRHPEWAAREPFRSASAGDLRGLAAVGERGLVELVMATHAGSTPDEFAAVVADWLGRARHQRFGRAFTELLYQPMLEVLRAFRAQGFRTFIVSGGGAEFLRVFAEATYGIPPDQVVGSTIRTRFETEGGVPRLIRLPEIDFVDDGPGKPVGIGKHIGRRPIAAFGNSDGDLQMLQYVTHGEGRRLGVIVRHDDAEREYAYDRESHVGRLDRALDEAPRVGWTVVSMRADWARVFPWI